MKKKTISILISAALAAGLLAGCQRKTMEEQKGTSKTEEAETGMADVSEVDGTAVVVHDETIDRVSDGKGPVRDYTFA